MRPSLSALFLLASFSIKAQNLKAYEQAGDEAFTQKEYYNAVHYYDIVLRSKKTAGVYYKYAEASRLSHAYQAAEEAYKKVVDSREKSRYPMLEFYYGITLKHNAKYNEAKRAFRYFLDRYRKDNFYKAKAQQELASCDFAKQLTKQGIAATDLSIEHLNENINTKYSDFGAHEVDSLLFYSSLRFNRKREKGEKKEKDLSKRIISRLLATADKEKVKGLEIENLNIPHEHTANSALSHDGQWLYFTRCSGKKSDSLRCEIYRSERLDKGGWGPAERLPNPINSSRFTTTQPNLEWQASSQTEWLYFCSDRPGGLGNMDIWRVELKTDLSDSEPYNLGAPINSIDAEATPFYDDKSNRLYFSSRWHFGLGGFDIFYSEYVSEDTWAQPINLGLPFNTAANDLYYVINKDDTSGYIASNRAGSRSLTKESCCNDIYRYTYLSPTAAPPVDTPDLVEVPIRTIDNSPKPTPSITEVPLPDTNAIVMEPTDTTTIEVPEIPTDVVQQLDDMLPLNLYFHNDEPDSNVQVKFTKTPYEASYNYYISLMSQYKSEYAGQFNPERAATEQQLVQQFFDDQVRGEYNRTKLFFDQLLDLLATGAKLQLYIRGYTSPRAEKRYNIALAHRRVNSLKNFMLQYKGSAFKKYVNNAQIIIKEAMLGESMVPKGVISDYGDPANSIYSVDASRERRAEISVLIRQ